MTQTTLQEMTDDELDVALVEAGRRFDNARQCERGGSAGEGAWERMGEISEEIRRRKPAHVR